MSERVRPYEGVHNFRDYGGYQAAAGTMKSGILWRSGQHGTATVEDLGGIAAIGIRTVIDLRGDAERRDMPCLRHETFAADVLFAPGETAGSELAPHEEAGKGIHDAPSAIAAMTKLYANMPFRTVLVGSLRLYFEALATRDGASLVHCLAGKDRTGLAVALVHQLLGVHHDDMMADYLLTRTAGNPAARIASAAPGIRARYGAAMSDEAVNALMGVEPVYLDTAFAAIRDRHGDVHTYAAEVLGVDAKRRAAIEERLVA